MEINLAGLWSLKIDDGSEYSVHLPGTLDTFGIGAPDEANLNNRFTRLYVYEGEAYFTRTFELPKTMLDKRVFFEAERARALRLIVNGQNIASKESGTLSTPYRFEITDFVWQGKNTLTVISDNSYKAMPRRAILCSSAATNETQTNWNGLLGTIRLRFEDSVFIDDLRVYPHGHMLDVELDLDAGRDYEGMAEITCKAFQEAGSRSLSLKAYANQRQIFLLCDIPLADDVKLWDELEGNLYSLTVTAEGCAEKTVSFGIRDFGVNEAYRLTLNNRVFFLRGETNCAVFPETGHPPVSVGEWREILNKYALYGVNCMRFHSWCPPRAAFIAADEMGMLMQPELSHWDYERAFEEEESYKYYCEEARSIMRYLANHPSFVMLSFGNELWAEKAGHKRMAELLAMMRALDATRLYANSSNPLYGTGGANPFSDFYTSHDYKDLHLRGASTMNAGHINEQYPNSKTDYCDAVTKVHEHRQPVFGFEVGQFEILPDFTELEDFKGVTRAKNLEIIKERVVKKGWTKQWQIWVQATGELAFITYREEIEAVLRTEGMSGLSLLGLQDFPGQGTALVGMMDSHLNPKPYPFADPQRFRKIFAPVLPLLYLDKYTYTNEEILRADVKLANYDKFSLEGTAFWQLTGDKKVFQKGSFPMATYPNGGLQDVGSIEVHLSALAANRYDLEIKIGEYDNTYPIWIYPKYETIPEAEKDFIYFGKNGNKVKVVSSLDDEAKKWLDLGGVVYLEPEPTLENIPESIGGQFSTDFWSVGTFPEQEGGMGMVIDDKHPALSKFPSESHSNWQWWLMSNGRPIILPEHIESILTVPDSYLRMKNMGLLFEARLGNGILMMSGMGLRFKQEYPEATALLRCLLEYLCSGHEVSQRIDEKSLTIWGKR